MVIGEQFAWCHMPKTGGDTTLELFQLLPRLIVHADPRNVEAKHTTFAEREHEITGKLLACNLRRLPAWTLSWDQHFSQHRVTAMSSPQEMAERPRGDRRLAHYTAGGRFHIDRWLRMEYLAMDFTAFVSELTDPTDGERHSIANYPPVNALSYDHEIDHWFTPAQVRQMYASNPVWAALEERVYGNLALLD
jgi:hypothetical protein